MIGRPLDATGPAPYQRMQLAGEIYDRLVVAAASYPGLVGKADNVDLVAAAYRAADQFLEHPETEAVFRAIDEERAAMHAKMKGGLLSCFGPETPEEKAARVKKGDAELRRSARLAAEEILKVQNRPEFPSGDDDDQDEEKGGPA